MQQQEKDSQLEQLNSQKIALLKEKEQMLKEHNSDIQIRDEEFQKLKHEIDLKLQKKE